MRTFVSALLAFAALEAAAFDSAEWLCKREVMTREAERLRGVYYNCLARVTAPAVNVSVPVETFDDGSVKTLVSAAQAQYFLNDGLVWGTGVVVRTYAKGGVEDGCLIADSCVVDRNSKCGWAEGKAVVVHGKTTFSGNGAFFSSSDSYVKVFGDSRIKSENMKIGSSLPGAAASTVKGNGKGIAIASVTSDFDRKEGVVMFDGSVVIDYADEYTMCADRAFVLASPKTREISRVVASGNVSVTNGTRYGSCSTAVYRRSRNEVEMLGDAVKRATLIEKGERDSELTGTRIRFWVDAEQVEVDNSKVSIKGMGKERLL